MYLNFFSCRIRIRSAASGKLSQTKRMPATARMHVAVWIQAKAVAQAATVTPVTSNRKDNINIMTAYNSRNANNSKYESNNSTIKPLTQYERQLKQGCLKK